MYTPEQIKDIKEREAKAIQVLKELELTPAIQMSWENNGKDAFMAKPIPYLQDTKYSATPSPYVKPTETS